VYQQPAENQKKTAAVTGLLSWKLLILFQLLFISGFDYFGFLKCKALTFLDIQLTFSDEQGLIVVR